MNLPQRDHNNPPEVIELASGVVSEISIWMADNPVVETEEAARAMKMHVDRAKLLIKDLEDERRSKTDPLNARVAILMDKYRGPRRLLGDLLDEMLARIQTFVKAEEARRVMEAARLAEKARLAELAAKEAERIEKEKLEDAAAGEVGIDVAEVISKADQAFDEYAKMEREAIRAERDIHVKIGGGFARAIGLKEKETLTIDQPMVAIMMMGITPDIRDAILKSARAWRKVHGKLPDGIGSTVEKKL